MGSSVAQIVCRDIQTEKDLDFQIDEDLSKDIDLERPLTTAFQFLQFNHLNRTKASVFSQMNQKQKNQAVKNEEDQAFQFEITQSFTPLIASSNQNRKIDFSTESSYSSSLSIFQGQTPFPLIPRSTFDYISHKKQSIEESYKIESLISSSKKSSVYEGISIEDGTKRIIKQIRVFMEKQKDIGKDSELKIKSVVGILPLLDHSNIMRIYEIFQQQEKILLVLEHFEISLQKLIQNQKTKNNNCMIRENDEFEELIKTIIRQILRALCYMHQKNIAHLKISEKSIMLVKESTNNSQVIAKLVEFGSCRTNITSTLSKMSGKNKLSALEAFEAPEIQNQSQICLKTDIWHLGIVLLKAMTRSTLIPNERMSMTKNEQTNFQIKVFWRQCQDKYDLNENCFDLLMKMLEVNESKRWSARQCLDHPWFLTDLSDPDEKFGGCSQIFRILEKENRFNNFQNLVKNVLLYKNVGQKQIHEFSLIFHEVDKDHSGVIQYNELIDYLERSRQYEKEKIKNISLQIIENIDNNESGTIDFIEFLHSVCNLNQYLNELCLSKVFDHLDQNGDGEISLIELQRVFKGCDFDEIEKYMAQIDSDFDGNINKQEFLKYCSKTMTNQK